MVVFVLFVVGFGKAGLLFAQTGEEHGRSIDAVLSEIRQVQNIGKNENIDPDKVSDRLLEELGEAEMSYIQSLSGLLCPDCLPILEKAVDERDYNHDFFGLKETLLIVKTIIEGDTLGESRHSQKLKMINAREEEQMKKMPESTQFFQKKR